MNKVYRQSLINKIEKAVKDASLASKGIRAGSYLPQINFSLPPLNLQS